MILVPGSRPGSHDLARHIVVTEQATAIVGSEMLRQRSVDEAEERARGDFVQALVHGSFSSEHDMRARAEHHDIDLDSRFGVFVAPGAVPRGADNPTAAWSAWPVTPPASRRIDRCAPTYGDRRCPRGRAHTA